MAVSGWQSPASRLMFRWRVDLFGKKLHGAIEASEEQAATAEAAKQFHITPARRQKLVVTQVIVAARDTNKSPNRSRG